MKIHVPALAATLAVAAVLPLSAETRVTLKSAKAGSSYYQMSVEIAEALDRATDGEVQITVEESQGSVQNVMEVRARGGDYVFTSPPALTSQARDGEGPFADAPSERFAEIRALFPMPSLTMHVVVDADAGVADFSDLAGMTMLLGKGSFGATEGERYLELFGVAGEVEIADVELSNAVPALQNGQIDGFVTAGSFPAPNVVEAAATTEVHILSMTDEQVAETGRTRLVIPAGTYPGQEEDVVTTSLPVIAYGTAAMDEDTAYQLTKAFWEEREAMAGSAPWWGGVNPDLVQAVEGPFHEGALRYYEEAGIEIPAGS